MTTQKTYLAPDTYHHVAERLRLNRYARERAKPTVGSRVRCVSAWNAPGLVEGEYYTVTAAKHPGGFARPGYRVYSLEGCPGTYGAERFEPFDH